MHARFEIPVMSDVKFLNRRLKNFYAASLQFYCYIKCVLAYVLEWYDELLKFQNYLKWKFSSV